MNTYKVTILNIISFKKRRIKIKALGIIIAMEIAIRDTTVVEEITKAELIIPKEK